MAALIGTRYSSDPGTGQIRSGAISICAKAGVFWSSHAYYESSPQWFDESGGWKVRPPQAFAISRHSMSAQQNVIR